MIFAVLLVAHWVGDFLLQSSKMATEKSFSLKWLSIHVLVYSLTIGAFSLFVFPLMLVTQYILINGALHWVTDFFTSKMAARHQGNPRIFYPVLGFDQMVHALCLYVTYIYYQNLL
ncbi:DUF3307 domain-containing protein [Flagellimonas flava]|uniref:DUF3307 domain-containing protein n=1 Tax=Flagellimonas flava TaxID=570519 RepID=A0A1M5N607_9FLAO|nr:DUF3307 domain-containing protein [Allomuricauda flava]SHG85020.1 Protein of unknown function [Allomuricauda flava]